MRDPEDLVWGILLTVLAVCLAVWLPPVMTTAWLVLIIVAPVPGLILLGRYFIGRPIPEDPRWHQETTADKREGTP